MIPWSYVCLVARDGALPRTDLLAALLENEVYLPDTEVNSVLGVSRARREHGSSVVDGTCAYPGPHGVLLRQHHGHALFLQRWVLACRPAPQTKRFNRRDDLVQVTLAAREHMQTR